MKKIILSLVAVFAFGFTNAQDTKFGMKAGVDFASLKAKVEGASASASETGFYLGAFVDINMSDKFAVQPSLLYVSVNDLNQIQLPILAKISVGEKFSLLAGPNIGFILDADPGMKSLNLGLDFGASYDVSEKLSIEAKYDMGLSNLLEDAPSGVSVKLSGVFVGLGYKF